MGQGPRERVHVRQRTHRLRRVGAAALLGMGMTAGVIGVTAGVAGAATANGITATAHPTITNDGLAQSAGAFKVTVAGSTAYAATDKLKVVPTFTGVTVTTTTKPTVDEVLKTTAGVTTTTAITAAKVTMAATSITVEVNATTTSDTTITFTFTAPKYIAATTAKAGKVELAASLKTSATGALTPAVTIPVNATVYNATVALAPASTRGNSITATSAPTVPKTGTANAGGNLTITLRGNGAIPATTYVNLNVAPTVGTVFWSATPTVTSTTVTAAVIGTPAGTNHLTIKLTSGIATGHTAKVHVNSITYNTAGAEGTVTVTPHWVNNATTATATTNFGTFSPATAVNAKAPAAPATTAHTHALVAKSTPFIGRGVSAAVGNWTLHLAATSSNATTAKAEGWTATQTITLTVNTNAGTNCSTTKDYVLVTGTPTATVATATTVSATPAVKVTTGVAGTCKVNNHNVVSLTFTNSGKFTGTKGSFHILVSGVKYSVGATAATGTVSVGAKFTTTGATFQAASITTATHTGPSNADVTLLYVTANTPAVTVTADAFDAAISPIDVNETAVAQVSAGYVCTSLATGNVFNTSASATIKVTKGTATVTSKVTYQKTTGSKATTTASAAYAVFKVTKASAVTASTFALSGLKVNASGTAGAVLATVKHVALGTTCNATGTSVGAATAYTVKSTTTVIYGATADATAVKELEHEFPTTTNTTNATPTKFACPGYTDLAKPTAVRPVILATTKTYQDALSSSYLAGYLHTGTLLTPTTMLSSVTKQALRTEGVTQVYVVGGPLAVTTTVVAQIETLPAYSCGGVSPLKTGKTTVFIHVTRIYGQTQYGTAERIAETPSASYVNTMTFTGAYAGVNATKGDGMYNTTAGTASTAPLTSAAVPTAILASGVEFQDAMAASAVAYGTSLPVLLTAPTALSSQAAAAIATLGIKQVILMGGQLAVTNTVVKQLQAMGVSVLRIAGKNYTGTAVQLAMFEQNTATVSGLGWPTGTGVMTSAYVARGNGFTDALAGAVLTGNAHLPQLLTLNPTTVGATLTAFLKAAGKSGKGVNTTATAKISTLTILGGPLAVSPSTIAKMETDIS